MGREEGKRTRCHVRGFVPLGGHSLREEKEALELPPLEVSLATNIQLLPKHVGWTVCGMERARSTALLSPAEGAQLPSVLGNRGEENGKDGFHLTAQLTYPQVSWRRAVGITWLPKEQLKNHIRSLDSKTTAGVGSGLSPRGNGTAEAADRGLRDAQVPALAPRLTECLQHLLPARKSISRYSKSSAFCNEPPPRAPSFVPATLLSLSQHGLEHPATGQGLNSIAGQN